MERASVARHGHTFGHTTAVPNTQPFTRDLSTVPKKCRCWLGDLAEEFQLRLVAVGERKAVAWYGEQVRTTVSAHIWQKLERLTAIGTLIDFVSRLLR